MDLLPQQVAEHLKRTDLLGDFSIDQLEELARHTEQHLYAPGEFVYRQGSPPLALYVLVRGTVVEQVREEGRAATPRTYGPGQCFGHEALAQATLQRGSVQAATETSVLLVPADEFGRLMVQSPRLREFLIPSEMAACLRAVPILGHLSDQVVMDLATVVGREQVAAGRKLLLVGQRDNPLIIIRSGQVELTAPTRRQIISSGNFFGEETALTGVSSSMSAVALTAADLILIPSDAFRGLLDSFPNLRDSLRRPDIAAMLRRAPMFSELSDEDAEHLSAYVVWAHTPRGYPITSQGQPGERFLILDTGEAIVRAVDELGRDRPRAYLRPGSSFGETSLVLGGLRDATVEATAGTNWLVLHREDYQAALAERPSMERRLTLRRDTFGRLNQPQFGWLRPGELVVEKIRRHGVLPLRRLAIPVLIAAASIALWGTIGIPPWLSAAVLGVDALAALWIFLDWRDDYLVITCQRLTHQERVWPISERRVEAPLSQIQDVTVTRGLLGNALDYGLVRVQTAAAVGKIQFDMTPKPMQVKEIILDSVARAHSSAKAEYRDGVRKELDRRLKVGLEPHIPTHALAADATGRHSAGDSALRRGSRVRPWLRQETESSVTWRKHWLRIVARVWLPLLLTALWVAALVLVVSRRPAIIPLDGVFWFIWIALQSAVLFWLWWELVDWGNDVYIVSRDRIIDIEKRPLFFSEERREASLGMVQNVSATIPGPLAYFFNYGHVEIHTAADIGRFDFMYVPNPREVQAEIFRRIEGFRSRDAERQALRRQAELADWFEMYHRLTSSK